MADNSQPQTNPSISLSTPGNSAQSNAVTNPNNVTPTSALSDVIPGMFKEQSLKANNPKLRFSLSIPGGATFQAHLDPNDVVRQQEKRIAALDVLTGVVIQDFAYKVEMLEVKGTTGSRYYQAIQDMDAVFNSQNSGGQATPVSLFLENVNYSVVWTKFSYSRVINPQAGNLINYSMEFLILKRDNFPKGASDSIAATAPTNAMSASQTSQNSKSNSNAQTNTPWTGTLSQYINSTPGLGPTNYSIALEYIQSNWNTITSGAFPGPNQPLTPSQTIPSPPNWGDIIGSGIV